MIVTLDGPAGAGKSSIARQLAARLNFAFLDTGAMYRGVTLYCLRHAIPLDDAERVSEAVKHIEFSFADDRTWMNGEDVSQAIRTPQVTVSIRSIADNQEVRRRLVALQRAWAGNRNVVTEGRDQGTVAFPEAECKIFLTASPEERARRRVAQLTAQGAIADYDEILRQQSQRDDEDTHRGVGGLRTAPDSIYVHTDGLSEEEVLQRLLELVETKRVKRS